MAKPARTASSEAILRKAQGLKPESFLDFTARLKSCPDTKPNLLRVENIVHSGDFQVFTSAKNVETPGQAKLAGVGSVSGEICGFFSPSLCVCMSFLLRRPGRNDKSSQTRGYGRNRMDIPKPLPLTAFFIKKKATS
jgi:hypothetical protein